MYEKKKVYVVVKTYPTISREYSELVCTAGILEDGTWIRLYPVPFRKLDFDRKYKKYTWIEVNAEKNQKDFRPETYRPDLSTLQITARSEKKINWDERRRIIFKNQKIYTNRDELISTAKKTGMSLAIFKPTKVLDFVAEETERNWDSDKLEILQNLAEQQNLFQTPEEIEKEFRIVNKVPYRFSYIFLDDENKKSKLMIEDWEIGMLYFNCLESVHGDEKAAIEKVKSRYLNDFLEKDLYFFVGTTLKHHNVAKNPFIIIGTFHPPKQSEFRQICWDDILG